MTGGPEKPRRVVLRLAWKHLPLTLLIFCVLSVLVRLTLRDRVFPVSTLYYATPPAVTAFLLACAAAAWFGRRKWLPGAVSAVLCLACTGWFFGASLVSNPTPDAGRTADLRIFLWNAQRPREPGTLVERIRGTGADVIAIVEAAGGLGKRPELWRKAFPDHAMTPYKGGLLLLAPGALDKCEWIYPKDGHGALEIHARIAGRPVLFLFIDFSANLFRDRRPAFAKVRETASRFRDRPIVILGDFNTPVDSIFFDDLRSDFRHAFETAGSGLNCTWPSPVPVVDIDQVWCSRNVEILRCEHLDGWPSDHRPVLVDISFGGPP
ncbi:MAG: endonuclease/exonuclease/phosphatase family protein [Planctomycetota bacterium]|jgi:endonuclease/exonuclease/phosphatase (EEP) superfamily protein YafD